MAYRASPATIQRNHGDSGIELLIAGNGKIYWLAPTYDAARSGTLINHSYFGQFVNLSTGAALALLLTLALFGVATQVGQQHSVRDRGRQAFDGARALLVEISLESV